MKSEDVSCVHCECIDFHIRWDVSGWWQIICEKCGKVYDLSLGGVLTEHDRMAGLQGTEGIYRQ